MSRLGELERIGLQMSNVCFNLAQRRAGEPLTDRDLRTFAELRVEWDAALSRLKRRAVLEPVADRGLPKGTP